MTDTTTNRGAAAEALAGGSTDQTKGTEQQTNGATQTTQSPEKFWYSDLDPVLQGNLEKKAFNTPTGLPKLVEGYFELEKQYRSGDKVMLPKDENDQAGKEALWNRIGRPDDASKYEFPEGVDPEYSKKWADRFYKYGATKEQVRQYAADQLQDAREHQEMERQRIVADQNQADQQLKQEWGSKYAENIELARRAMRGLGINLDQHFVPIAGILGSKKTLEWLHLAGINTRESNAASIGDAQAGFGLTPNRAKAELAEKGAELLRRAKAGDASAKAHWQRLNKAIAGDGNIEM